jgi:hemin uptake protein HemP
MNEGTQSKEDSMGDEANDPSAPSRATAGEVRTVVARELLGTRGLLRIEHEGETYMLRLTRNNRLILTK